MKTAIVSAANQPFFAMLCDMLDSLDRCRQGDPIDVCILDVGLSAEQRATLSRRVAHIIEPGWDFDFPGRDTQPRFMQAMLARPFLPRHFPQYDRYIHLDADVWLQDWRAIELLLLPSQTDTLVIVPEIHRAYQNSYRANPIAQQNMRATYTACFGETIADQLSRLPIINAGVWAMRRDVPFWETWAQILQTALNRHARPLTEQCALNVALYTGKIPFYSLPAWCNWMCPQAIPLLDLETRMFHEPLLPHELISIIHQNDLKCQQVDVQCSDNVVRKMPLTYAAAQATAANI